MNRSFDFVMRSTLNNSKSKETHLFPQSKRFNYPKPPKYVSAHAAVGKILTTSPKPCWHPKSDVAIICFLVRNDLGRANHARLPQMHTIIEVLSI